MRVVMGMASFLKMYTSKFVYNKLTDVNAFYQHCTITPSTTVG